MEGLSEICLQIPDNAVHSRMPSRAHLENATSPCQAVIRGGGIDKLPPHDLLPEE
jgi:hypothetical protein